MLQSASETQGSGAEALPNQIRRLVDLGTALVLGLIEKLPLHRARAVEVADAHAGAADGTAGARGGGVGRVRPLHP